MKKLVDLRGIQLVAFTGSSERGGPDDDHEHRARFELVAPYNHDVTVCVPVSEAVADELCGGSALLGKRFRLRLEVEG